jgi:acyl dehydratase
MALNRACLDKQYPFATTVVTPEATQGYARACNEDNPRYFDPAVPGGIVASPMFAAVVTWIPVISVMTDPQLRADLLRLLHTAQDMEFLAPIRPGDTISATARISSIETVAGGEALTLELDASNQHRQRVNHALFTALIRGRRYPPTTAEARSAPATDPSRGAPLAVIRQTLDRDQTFRYAEASGDRNPIHVDDNVARMAGLPGIVVHGLCTMAFACRAVVDNLCGADPMRLKRLAVRFSRPVFPGESITTSIWQGAADQARPTYSFETTSSEGLAVIRDGIAVVAS